MNDKGMTPAQLLALLLGGGELLEESTPEGIVAAERSGQRELASHMAPNLRLFEKRQPSRMPWMEWPTWMP